MPGCKFTNERRNERPLSFAADSGQATSSIDHGAMLANFAAKINLGALPPEVIQKLKHLLIDTPGVTLGAMDQAHAKQTRAVAVASECTPQASILGTELKTSAPEAAFANGVAAHGIDFDGLPKVVQFNKRDMPDVKDLAEIKEQWGDTPTFPAVATRGEGILETFHELMRVLFRGLEDRHDFSVKFSLSEEEFLKGVMKNFRQSD